MTESGADTEDGFLVPTAEDRILTAARDVLNGLSEIPFVSTGMALALETLPTANERQHARALRTLWSLMHELQDIVTAEDWRRVSSREAFDAAALRALRAAEEAQAEEKRELIWFGLMNGWVRLHGDTERDRFLRIVSKYDLKHFHIMEEIQKVSPTKPTWTKMHWLTEMIGGDRFAARAYIHEMHADGIVQMYDQPEIRKADRPSVMTHEIVLWTDAGDRLLEFVKRPVAPPKGKN
ncbi:hypothetical protein [Microbacterium sp. LMC-P-041]|uniref:hypothetical protein n=1 Tax=Microbacterium sp. LMC-P-041 TaxID=3040293 RepID=UPI0025554A0F|nr:hypothetical protein [Microbacterium sp. LMC-P-041]